METPNTDQIHQTAELRNGSLGSDSPVGDAGSPTFQISLLNLLYRQDDVTLNPWTAAKTGELEQLVLAEARQ
jgi:hypothetical protein